MNESDELEQLLQVLVNLGMAYGYDQATDEQIEGQKTKIQALLARSNARHAVTVLRGLREKIILVGYEDIELKVVQTEDIDAAIERERKVAK